MSFEEVESLDPSQLSRVHSGLNRQFISAIEDFKYIWDSEYGLIHLNDSDGFKWPMRSAEDGYLLIAVL